MQPEQSCVLHLPPELVDLIFTALGNSAEDRAARNALLCCFLVSRTFRIHAQKHYYRKLTIRYSIGLDKPLPEREHHLVRLFFDNPHILGFIQELVVLFDEGRNADDRLHRHEEPTTPISQELLLDRFPWPTPPVALADVPPLLLLLRHSPIHTARFALVNAACGTVHVAARQHLAPICSIPCLRRFYFMRVLPASPLLDDELHPDLLPGLERLELLWVASQEQEFSAPIDIPSILSPSQTSTIFKFPSRQVIRTNTFIGCDYGWLRPRQLFRSWFPDYTPSPDLEQLSSARWGSKFMLGFPLVRDALDNMHNVCPSIRRVAWANRWYRDCCFIDIAIEQDV